MGDAPDSFIQQLINQYSANLRYADAETTLDMTKAWMKVEQTTRRDIMVLSSEIERRVAMGEEVTDQMLWKMESYKRTLANLEVAEREYSEFAYRYIGAARTDVGMLGVEYANEMMRAQIDYAAFYPQQWERLNVEAVQNMMAVLDKQNPWWSGLQDIYGESVMAMKDAMIESVALGLGVTQMADKMQNALSIGLDRSMLIAQTEMGRAYRTGTIGQYRSSGVVEYYVRLVKKQTACLACLVLDGEKYELEEDMQDHPRGYCDTIAKVKGVPLPNWEKGKDWLENQPTDVQRKIMGETRFGMYNNGFTGLDDMVTKVHDPIWGTQPAIKPLGKTPGYESFKKFKAEQKAKGKAKQATVQNVKVKPAKGHLITGNEYEELVDGIDNMSMEMKRQIYGNGDEMLGEIYRRQGFDGKAGLVSEAELQEMIRNGEVDEYYRGLTRFGDKSGGELCDMFKKGDHYPGYGVYGNGTYMAKDKFVAEGYANGIKENVMHIGLRKDAKIIMRDDLMDLNQLVRVKMGETKYLESWQTYEGRLKELATKLKMREMELDDMVYLQARDLKKMEEAHNYVSNDLIHDWGRQAALFGYDGVYIPECEYMVLLNRTMLVVVK